MTPLTTVSVLEAGLVRTASLLIGSVVFLVAWGLTRVLCGSGAPLYRLDHPNERSLHDRPTPRTGGVAIIAGLATGLAVDRVLGVLLNTASVMGNRTLGWIVGSTLVIAAISFWDDRRGLPAALRLVVHVLAAVVLVVGVGLVVERVPIPMMGTLELGAAGVPVTLLLVVWMTNLYNFMDGMDGFAGGMTVIGFVCLAWLAWRGTRYALAAFALMVAASAGGFLVHNLPPARIFMGDVGSVSLGFLAGSLTVFGVHERLFDVWAPILIFAPFVVDATVTLVRRLLAGERVWRPHRTHWYQRAVLAGLGHRKTVMLEYALMIAGAFTAVAYAEITAPGWRAIMLLGWAAAWPVVAYRVRALETHRAGSRRHAG